MKNLIYLLHKLLFVINAVSFVLIFVLKSEIAALVFLVSLIFVVLLGRFYVKEFYGIDVKKRTLVTLKKAIG